MLIRVRSNHGRSGQIGNQITLSIRSEKLEACCIAWSLRWLINLGNLQVYGALRVTVFRDRVLNSLLLLLIQERSLLRWLRGQSLFVHSLAFEWFEICWGAWLLECSLVDWFLAETLIRFYLICWLRLCNCSLLRCGSGDCWLFCVVNFCGLLELYLAFGVILTVEERRFLGRLSGLSR